MKKLITTTPAKRIRIPYIGISGFERFINRSLTTYERRIIASIATQTAAILTPTSRRDVPPARPLETAVNQPYVGTRHGASSRLGSPKQSPISRRDVPPARPLETAVNQPYVGTHHGASSPIGVAEISPSSPNPRGTTPACPRPATPIIVIDPPGHDSTSLLQAYVSYRLAIGPTNATAAILTPFSRTPAPPARPSESTVNQPKVGTHHGASARSGSPNHDTNNKFPPSSQPPRLQLLTYRNPDHLRGHSIAYTLLLNIQDAKTFSPYKKYPDNFYRLWHTLLPMLPPYGFLIIHITAPRTKRQRDRLDTLFGNKISRIQKIHPETPTKYGSTAKKVPTIIITLTDDVLRNTDPPPDGKIVHSPLSILNCKRRS